MRDRDLADSSLASCPPEPVEEPLAELLKDAVAPYVPPSMLMKAFKAIDATLEANGDPGGGQTRIFETLRAIFGDTRLPEDVRRMACAAAIGANDPEFGKSYQHYADYFGVTRACIHSDARDVQRKFGVRARRDKKDEARATSTARAKTRPVRRLVRNPARLMTFFPGL